jgi:hypothetical protein
MVRILTLVLVSRSGWPEHVPPDWNQSGRRPCGLRDPEVRIRRLAYPDSAGSRAATRLTSLNSPPISSHRVASLRPAIRCRRSSPRAFDYPVGYNYIYQPRSTEPIGFAELRALAQNHDITRLCIETRKDQIEALEWAIKPRDERNPKAGAEKRADALTEFWRCPDRRRGL